MPVSPLPPIPAEPDVERLAPEGDFVERGALETVLLGVMPTAGESGRLVSGRPPRGDFAGFGEGMMPAPIEKPLAFPVAALREVRSECDKVLEFQKPVLRREKVAAPVVEPLGSDRVAGGDAELPADGGGDGGPASFRRPPEPRAGLAGRRAAPPRLRRGVEDPEAAFGTTQPRVAGIWVMLSSAAASIVLLLLTTVGLNRHGRGAAEPVPVPVTPGAAEEVAETVPVRQPTRLASTEKEEF